MEKLKERITEKGIDYILVGDYYIPVQLPYPDREIMDISCQPERAGGGNYKQRTDLYLIGHGKISRLPGWSF